MYNTIALPAATAMLAVLALLFASASYGGRISSMRAMLLPVVLVAFLVWIAALLHTWRRFGSFEAVWLSLLAHMVLGGYLIGLLMMFGGLIGAFRGPWTAAYFGAMLFLGAGLFVVGRLGERFIARRCIKRHLRISAGTMSA